ncbi:NYN domain-containing protein [Candidatus Gottesmanbacteria bacterium]|nr:NYN domain-containing protein [Candidatus Gottesmanbacteria bacterium]
MKKKKTQLRVRTYAFIDASNLFYGGEKSLGWKIDYSKLIKYLRKKYEVSHAFYFGGVEIHGYQHDYLKYETVPIILLEKKLVDYIKKQGKQLNEAQLLLLSKHLQRIRFYIKLEQFGYKLLLKPVKLYHLEDGSTQRKANCDVDMAFYLMKEKDNFNRVLVLSGDGDFLPVLKYLRKTGKVVIVLARGERAAKEIRRFAGSDFRDFNYLREQLKFMEKK